MLICFPLLIRYRRSLLHGPLRPVHRYADWLACSLLDLPDSSPGQVCVGLQANHTSHLDALVIWASLPPSIREIARPVAAKDYWSRGFVRRWLASDVFDALLIDRTDIKVHQSPVDLMIREIGTTRSLIVFPEGGRSVTGEVAEFKSGLYYLAKKRPDIELIPVHIDNLNRVLPRGEFLPVPLLSCITFGPPLWLEMGEQKAEFLARARRAVLALKE
jgi:1-acyl-sn-glycerol-3-phosphate acyltransferase